MGVKWIHHSSLGSLMGDEASLPTVCPVCDPARVASGELVEARLCERHMPPRDGADDGRVDAASYLNTNSEGTDAGLYNWAMCDMLHGPARRRARKGRRRARKGRR